jgi:ParB family transcriptional regulator, chromosome partitioning protein
MSKRGGLGRGLSALIPGAPDAGDSGTGLLEVPTGTIAPNPKQPRSRFEDEAMGELAASIREVGILQPIVVRRTGQGYEVVAGERRLRAAKLAGLATVPVVLRDSDDSDLLREALIENIHREDLNPIELGEAFRQLLDELGLKQEELADRVGVSRSHIANTIRLLALPLEVQQLLTDEKISAGHARALLAMGDAEAITALSLRVAAEDLSVRETEEIVRRFIEGPAEPAKKAKGPESRDDGAGDPNFAEVEGILSEQLATRVVIRMGRRRGQVVIEFGSADDLERIVSEIIGSGPGLAPD